MPSSSRIRLSRSDPACLTTETVARLVDGDAEADELEAIEAHLANCPGCARLVAGVALTRSRVEASARAASRAASSQIPAPKGLERFEILRKVGEGSMAVVYAARDRVLGRTVALKLLHPSAEGRGLGPRLLREATLLAAMSHPQIVTVYDVGVEGDQLFIALELVEGGTLRSILATSPPWKDVLDLFLRAGAGLAAAHEAGVVHRDFKPDNVLVGADGRVRVTDFGLARATGSFDPEDTGAADDGTWRPLASVGSRSGALLGTPAYMSPEQLRGEEATVASDVFAFCVSLYEGLYGQRPFAAQTLAALRQDTLEGRVIAAPPGSKVPASLRRALLEGLRAAPDERPRSMGALLAALKRAAAPRLWPRAGVAIAAAAIAGVVALGWARGRAETARAAPAPLEPCSTLGDADEVYVAADGSREPVGTAACPFHSLTAALGAAKPRADGQPRTIHLGPGAYTAAGGEAFPLVLRGVSVVGAGAGVTSIEGIGALDRTDSGGVLDRPGEMTHATVLVGDERAPTVLSGVTLRSGTTHRMEYMGVVCDRGTAKNDDPDAAPNTSLEDLVLGAEYEDGIVVGTSTRPGPSGCNARVRRTTIESSTAIWILGCGTGDGRVPVAAQIGDGTDRGTNVFRQLKTPGDHFAVGVDVWDCASAVSVNGNRFETGGVGVYVMRHADAPAERITIQHNTFQGLGRAGVLALRAASIATLEDNVFEGISALAPEDVAAGLWLDAEGEPVPPAVRRARRNVFSGNDTGVLANDTKGRGALSSDVLLDFGTEGDEGYNDFRCNSHSAKRPGFDVLLDFPGARGRSSFVGNAWDHAPLLAARGAPLAGDGMDFVFTGGPALKHGERIDPFVHGAGTLCPEGRIAGGSYQGN